MLSKHPLSKPLMDTLETARDSGYSPDQVEFIKKAFLDGARVILEVALDENIERMKRQMKANCDCINCEICYPPEEEPTPDELRKNIRDIANEMETSP